MSRLTRSLVSLLCLGVGIVSLSATDASARSPSERRLEEAEVMSGPLGVFYGYLTPVVVIERGAKLAHTNLDVVEHDVVHDVAADGVSGPKRKPWCKLFKGDCPLFWSPKVGFGEAVAVRGVEGLESNRSYSFFCTLHSGMKGKLVVLP